MTIPVLDIERARFNMIEQQIRPWEVLDQSVLDLLAAVKREEFVPAAYRNLAFVDMEVPLNLDGAETGECMLAPKVEARVLQSLALRPDDLVLEIGSGSGYMAALLGAKAREVTTVESNPISNGGQGKADEKSQSGDAAGFPEDWQPQLPIVAKAAKPAYIPAGKTRFMRKFTDNRGAR